MRSRRSDRRPSRSAGPKDSTATPARSRSASTGDDERPSARRFRAAAVHAGMRAALEGVRPSMAAPVRAPRPQAVLFACGSNSVRSPMAASLFGHLFGRTAYVGSAGVRKGELDPFAVAALDEIGLDI